MAGVIAFNQKRARSELRYFVQEYLLRAEAKEGRDQVLLEHRLDALVAPAGFVHGLPVGLSFVGAAYSEAALIKMAYAFEQATLHRCARRRLA
jgi:amidase